MLLGAQKAATSSVFHVLHKAGMVCGSSNWVSAAGNSKEAHFFDMQESWFKEHDNLYSEYVAQFSGDDDEKLPQFSGSGCTRFMDATPNYLFEGYGPERMRKVMGASGWMSTVKILVIVREPVQRDLAFYNHMKYDWLSHGKVGQSTIMGDIPTLLCKNASKASFPSYSTACGCQIHDWETNCHAKYLGKQEMTDQERTKAYHYCAMYDGGYSQLNKFDKTENSRYKEIEKKTGFTVREDQAIQNRLAHGMYKPQIEDYARVFSRDQILIMDFDRLLKNQATYIEKLVHFYGLPYHGNEGRLQKLPKENEKPFDGKVKTISCDTLLRLDSIWGPYNKDLFQYLMDTRESAPIQEKGMYHENESFLSKATCESGGEVVYTSDEHGSLKARFVADAVDQDQLVPFASPGALVPSSLMA